MFLASLSRKWHQSFIESFEYTRRCLYQRIFVNMYDLYIYKISFFLSTKTCLTILSMAFVFILTACVSGGNLSFSCTELWFLNFQFFLNYRSFNYDLNFTYRSILCRTCVQTACLSIHHHQIKAQFNHHISNPYLRTAYDCRFLTIPGIILKVSLNGAKSIFISPILFRYSCTLFIVSS